MLPGAQVAARRRVSCRCGCARSSTSLFCAGVDFCAVAGELPADLAEEARTTINRVVELQLSREQWTDVDRRLHQIAAATDSADTAALTSAVYDLADIENLIDSDGGNRIRDAKWRVSRPDPAPLRLASAATRVGFPFIAVVVVLVLATAIGGVLLLRSHESSTQSPPSPTPTITATYPSSPQPTTTHVAPPTSPSPHPVWAPARRFRFGVWGVIAVLVVTAGVVVAAVSALRRTGRARRRRRDARVDPQPNRSTRAGLLDRPIDLKVPSPDEVREFANRLVETLSAQGDTA
jgi:hypothetical protein